MAEKVTLKEIDKRVKTLYRMALVCYSIPFLFLGIYFLSNPEVLFWKMFLLGTFPFGLLGLLFTIMGVINASRNKNYHKRTRGYYNLFMGIIVIACGMLGWMLLYIVAS
jgi:hypothetical protein